MKFSRSQLSSSLALIAALLALAAPQALAASGGGASPGTNKKPTGGSTIGGTTEAQRKARRKRAEAKRVPVLTVYKLSNTALAGGSKLTLRYRFKAPAKRVRVRAIVRTLGGRYVKTLQLGVRSTNVMQKRSLSASELGVGRAGKFKLRLTAKDGKKRAAKRAKKIRAWLGFTFTDHRFPLTGPFSFGNDGARFGAGRPGHKHQGQDIIAAPGIQIVAPYSGVISFVDYQPDGAGYYVVENADDGRDYVFMHMLKGSTAVKAGQRVEPGDAIGKVGSTGASSGPHLHFESWAGGAWQFGGKPIDPLPLLQSWLASGPGGAVRTSVAVSASRRAAGPLD